MHFPPIGCGAVPVAWIAAAAFGLACAGQDPDPRQRSVALAMAQAGPWQLPHETRAIGDTQYVPYTAAGAWRDGAGCSGSVTPQAQALRDEVLARFDAVSFVGDYACRPINGDDTRLSVHGVGRAIDVHVPTTEAGEADNDLGDPIANWLVEHARAWQVQYLIWDGWQWHAGRAPGEKDWEYGGAHPHHDHLHVEVAADVSPETAGDVELEVPLSTQSLAAQPGFRVTDLLDRLRRPAVPGRLIDDLRGTASSSTEPTDAGGGSSESGSPDPSGAGGGCSIGQQRGRPCPLLLLGLTLWVTLARRGRFVGIRWSVRKTNAQVIQCRDFGVSRGGGTMAMSREMSCWEGFSGSSDEPAHAQVGSSAGR